MTVQWSMLNSLEQREVAHIFRNEGKLRAVQYLRTTVFPALNVQLDLLSTKQLIEQWIDTLKWTRNPATLPSTPACGFDVRQTRRERKQAELAKRYIEQVGGTVVLDTVTLRQREIEQLQYVLKNHLDNTNLAEMATLLKTCSKE